MGHNDRVRYVLVTDWRDHWDKIPGGVTSFSADMLVPPMTPDLLKSATPTLFLLMSRSPRAPLKAWTGRVTLVSHGPGHKKVVFRVRISKETRFPKKYAGLEDGWHVENLEAHRASSGLW